MKAADQDQFRRDAEAARKRLELLALAGTRLANSLEPQATLQAIAELLVPAVCYWLRVDLIPAARRAAPGDRCRYKDGAWACSTWSSWRVQQNDHTAVFYSDLPAPDSLAEHHFVVIASKEPIDLAQLDQRLDDLHDVRITAVAAARSASHYLMAKHEGTWTAYAMTVRIQGVR